MTGPNTIGASGPTRDKRLEVIVIGAGQAGLAVARHLAQRGLRSRAGVKRISPCAMASVVRRPKTCGRPGRAAGAWRCP